MISTSLSTSVFPMRAPNARIMKRPRQVSLTEAPPSPNKRPRTTTPPPQVVELIPPSVSFSSLPPREYKAPYSNLSSKEASHIWYSRAELSALRLQARLFLFGVKPPTDGGDPCTTRGYERLTDMPAHRRKLLARKAVVLAHHKYQLPPHKLAVIAQRVAEPSIQDAFMLACQDYCDVHCHLQPDEKKTKRAVLFTSTSTPPLRSILKSSSTSLSSRRVSVEASHSS